MSLDFDLYQAYELAQKLAPKAGEQARAMLAIPSMPHQGPEPVSLEASRDIVTSGDLQAQNMILDVLIKEGFNTIKVWAEDGDNDQARSLLGKFPKTGDLQWVIDGVDGSANYMLGNEALRRLNIKMLENIGKDPEKFSKPNQWGTMIGIESEGSPYFGVIYLPVFKQLFHAIHQQGAFMVLDGEQKKLSTSHHDFFNRDDPVYANSRLFDRLEKQDLGLKLQHHGCYAYTAMQIAREERCIIVAEQPKLHDLIPPMCIVREAGGVVLDEKGKDATVTSKYVVYGPNESYAKRFLEMYGSQLE